VEEPNVEDTVYKPRKLAEETVKCPVCGADTLLEVYVHDAPVPGPILILTMKCARCGYRLRDLAYIESRGNPLKITIRVEESNDLNTILFRGPRARIRIPELGLEIDPGPAYQGDITTVDGLLVTVQEHLEPLCPTLENPKKCREFLQDVEKFLRGEITRSITIEVLDPEGLSTIYRAEKRNYTIEVLDEACRKHDEKTT